MAPDKPKDDKPKNKGGRPKGSRNKRLIEKELLEQQRAAAWANRKSAGGNGKPQPKLAKQLIEDFMHAAAGYAATYQRANNIDKFQEWAKLAVEWASRLAPYQSPTYRAIVISPEAPPPDADGEVITTLEGVREHLLLSGVPVEQVARALMAREIDGEVNGDGPGQAQGNGGGNGSGQ